MPTAKEKKCPLKKGWKPKKPRKFNSHEQIDEIISSCCKKIHVKNQHYNSIKIVKGDIVIKHMRKCKACGIEHIVVHPESCTCGCGGDYTIVYEKCQLCQTKTFFIHFNKNGKNMLTKKKRDDSHQRLCTECGTIENIDTKFLDGKITCSCCKKT